MQILAGAAPAAAGFLHAGYTSAGPRSIENGGAAWERSAQAIDMGTPLDVAAALRLQDETPAAAPSSTDISVSNSAGAGAIAAPPASAFAMLFLMLIASLYLTRRVWRTRRRQAWMPAGMTLLLAGGLIWLAALAMVESANAPGMLPPPDARAPWDGVPVRAYADPPSATLVLMHGIVADALANAVWPVETLAQLRDRVGLPVKDLTEGERYAIQTYGLDGWGRPFRLEGNKLGELDAWVRRFARGQRVGSLSGGIEEVPHYRLTSAGADGAFDTGDDVVLKVPGLVEYSWDSYSPSPLLYKDGDRIVWLRHRWDGKLFRYANEEWARRLTGGPQFDLVPVDTLQHRFVYAKSYGNYVDVTSKVPQLYDRIAAGKPRPPLVLVVPPPEAPSRV